ncbi:hypothetical protein VTN31DRAFT_3571 [Thermomyces dupontii]|uniref:uncharacterized protein n=1 Tax=Talaromyces thermophilus TaxID=28565 RepID=UPI0037447085
MNVAIDNLNNMNWLVMPSDDPTSWNMPSANSLSFDYDLDLGGSDFSQYLDLEPKPNTPAAGEYFHLSNPIPSPEHSSSDSDSEDLIHNTQSDSNNNNNNNNVYQSVDTGTFQTLDTLPGSETHLSMDGSLALETDTTATTPISIASPSLSLAQSVDASSTQAGRKHSATDGSTDTPQEEDSEEAQRHKRKKLAHNIIEKRYRMNMNSKFIALSKALPNMGCSKQRNSSRRSRSSRNNNNNNNGEQQQPLPNKSEVLANALTYIRQLEAENSSLKKEIAVLKENLLPKSATSSTLPSQQQRRGPTSTR